MFGFSVGAMNKAGWTTCNAGASYPFALWLDWIWDGAAWRCAGFGGNCTVV